MWQLRLFLLVGAVVALAMGGHYTWVGLSNTSPVTISYQQYCQQRPDDKWLELTDTWVDYRSSVEIFEQKEDRYTKKRGEITKREYYTALFQGPEDKSNIVAFLKCNDPGSVALAKEGVAACALEEDKWLEWCAQNESRMLQKSTVRGLVLSGLSESSEHRRLLNSAAKGARVADFVIIDQNEEPRGGTGCFCFCWAQACWLPPWRPFC